MGRLGRNMKLRTLVFGYALALGLLLFAQRKPEPAQPEFKQVVDLTHSLSNAVPTYEVEKEPSFKAKTVATIDKDGYFAREISLPEHFGTHIDAPAHFIKGLWTVDEIPPERLVGPLVVIDVSRKAANNPDYQISVEDIAEWERVHGEIPAGAILMVGTGWDKRWNSVSDYRNPDGNGLMHFPGYSEDAAKFLVEARQVRAIGIDTLSIDYGPSKDFPVHRYTLGHSVYQLENVANLSQVPATGALAVVAPMKLEGGSGSPVRILALVK
jgi:kynurenine formamidase